MRLLVGSLVGLLSPSFCFVWYDLPTNSPTSDPTNNRTNWIWMSKKMGLKFNTGGPPLVWFLLVWISN